MVTIELAKRLSGAWCAIAHEWRYDVYDNALSVCLTDVAQASEMPSARNVCKLRYLNGASPVCYGVPVVVAPMKEALRERKNVH